MPERVAAYPEIADAQIELGRYEAAERTLQRMLDLKPNLAAYARVSYYRELNGDLDGARRGDAAGGVRRRRGAGERRPTSRRCSAISSSSAGEPAAARAAYMAALRSLPGYPAGLVGLARVDAAGGDLGRAAVRLRRASERLPLTGQSGPARRGRAALGNDAAAEGGARGRAGPAASCYAAAARRRTRRRSYSRRTRLAGGRRDARAPRLASRAERALRRRARLGADARGAARARGSLGAARPAAGLARSAVPAPRRDRPRRRGWRRRPRGTSRWRRGSGGAVAASAATCSGGAAMSARHALTLSRISRKSVA